jgi:hypothetical protein
MQFSFFGVVAGQQEARGFARAACQMPPHLRPWRRAPERGGSQRKACQQQPHRPISHLGLAVLAYARVCARVRVLVGVELRTPASAPSQQFPRCRGGTDRRAGLSPLQSSSRACGRAVGGRAGRGGVAARGVCVCVCVCMHGRCLEANGFGELADISPDLISPEAGKHGPALRRCFQTAPRRAQPPAQGPRARGRLPKAKGFPKESGKLASSSSCTAPYHTASPSASVRVCARDCERVLVWLARAPLGGI